MDISFNSALTEEQISGLLKGYRFGRYNEDRSLDRQGSLEYQMLQIKEHLNNETSESISQFSSNGELTGLLLLKYSQWDSDHFDKKIAIISSLITIHEDYDRKLKSVRTLLEAFENWVEERNIQFITVRIPAYDLAVINGFEESGYRYVEDWVYNKFDLQRLSTCEAPPFQLRLSNSNSNSKDLDYMLQFSKGAFDTQHFHADSFFDREKADSLYRKWIKTAFSDTKQEILVYDDEKGKPSAFMIFFENNLEKYFGTKFAMWKMLLLDPEKRGAGLGAKFVTSVLHHHLNSGYNVVDSGLSARNISSFNLHNKLGFKIILTYVTLHKSIVR